MDSIAAPPPGQWTTVLDEGFDGTSLNTKIWSKGYRWNPVINNELQGFVPENVVVANGVCTIKVEKRDCQNVDMNGSKTPGTMHYASGCLQSYTKWTQKYGYFEARIKMASGPGTWPAFWMLPDRGPSLQDPERVELGDNGHGMGNEIDVVEYLAAWKNSSGQSKSHCGYIWRYATDTVPAGVAADYGQANGGIGPLNILSNPDTQFHTYGVYWGPGVVIFYLDDQVILRRFGSSTVANVPEYLLLNCALSTDKWQGSKDLLTTDQIDAGLPCTMVIDYVRVYSGTAASAQKYEAENLSIPNYHSQAGGSARKLPSDPSLSNSGGIILDANNINDYLTFNLPSIAAQTYDVTVGIKKTSSRGTFQLQIGRSDNFSGTMSNVGPQVDEYDPGSSYTSVDLGSWTPGSTSDKWFRFLVTGKNAASTGTSFNDSIAIDYITLTPE